MNFDVDAVVFDLDGTLTDSIDWYYEIFREAAARFGVRVEREAVLGPMANGSNIWNRAVPEDLEGREEKLRQIRGVIPGIFAEVMKRVRTFPEVRSVLEALESRGIRMGIVTASWQVALSPLRRDGLLRYFRTVIAHEDGFAPKPAPDGVLECLRRMEVPPHRALVVGDSPMDIGAGRAAGARTVAVLSGVGTRELIGAEKPDATIDGIGQLLSVLSPPGSAPLGNGSSLRRPPSSAC